ALTVEDVDAAIEDDGVVALAADDVLDRAKDVDARGGAVADGAGRRDGGTRVGGREVDGVDPTGVAAVVGVVAVTHRGNEGVIAVAAAQHIRAGIARQQVVAGTAGDVLDVGDGEEAGGQARGQVHRDGSRRGTVTERVGTTSQIGR